MIKVHIRAALSDFTARAIEHLYFGIKSPDVQAVERQLRLLLEPHDWAIRALLQSEQLSIYDKMFTQELDRMISEIGPKQKLKKDPSS